ncbi:MAG: alpha/beta hydrolase [Phenylobacterium sp.]
MRRTMGLMGVALAGLLFLAGPAHAEDRYASNGAVKIHYVVQGKGPLVVLIHGFPDYWATWTPLMAELNRAGYRTAALDNRGYNLSDKPQGEAAYAMPNLIGDVAAVIKAEGQANAVVIGHDWGAAIAWQTALNRPDLVNKLVIMSVPTRPAWPGSWPPTRRSRRAPTTPATSRNPGPRRPSPPRASPAGSRTPRPGRAMSRPSSAPTSRP